MQLSICGLRSALTFFFQGHTARLTLVHPETPSFTLIVSRLFEWEWAARAGASMRNDYFHIRSFARYLRVASRKAANTRTRVSASRASVSIPTYKLRAHRIDCVNVGSADAFTFYTRYSLAPAVALKWSLSWIIYKRGCCVHNGFSRDYLKVSLSWSLFDLETIFPWWFFFDERYSLDLHTVSLCILFFWIYSKLQ